MNVARRTFYTDFITENSSDQGRFFRAAKKLLTKKEKPCFPDYHDKSVLANDIGQFFIRKVMVIRSDIDTIDDPYMHDLVPDDLEVGNGKSMNVFRPLTESDVRKLIQKSARKSCALDPMPSTLVVSCLDELLPVITCMVNSSLTCGYFPDSWKKALVAPLLKKTGLVSEFTNLRPVTNLQFISKLTECAVFEQTHSHMIQQSQWHSTGSGWWRYLSST